MTRDDQSLRDKVALIVQVNLLNRITYLYNKLWHPTHLLSAGSHREVIYTLVDTLLGHSVTEADKFGK